MQTLFIQVIHVFRVSDRLEKLRACDRSPFLTVLLCRRAQKPALRTFSKQARSDPLKAFPSRVHNLVGPKPAD